MSKQTWPVIRAWRSILIMACLSLVPAATTVAQYGELQLLPPIAPSTIPPAADVGLQAGAYQAGGPVVQTLGPPRFEPSQSDLIVPPVAAAAAEVPRVPEEILPAPAEPGYTWYQPQYWLPAPVWSGSIELGINGSAGNSETLSMKSGYKLQRKSEHHLLKSNLNYVRTESGGLETQHNALMKNDYERLFTDSPWSIFVNSALEYDEYKPFDLRVSLNSGLSYAVFNDDVTKLKYRFGAGASKELGGLDEDVKPEAVFGMDYERKLTERQSLNATLDYFPNWTDFADYRMVSDIGWQVLLDEASNLSLKVGVINRYDSTPNGSQPNDVNYSLLLLWKL